MGLLRTALPLIGTVVALAAADGASAQQQRAGIPAAPAWYLGAGGGVSYYDTKSEDFNIPSLAGGGMDNTGIAWKIFGGYRFTPYFGVEGSYVDLGSTSGPRYSAHSWNVAGVGRLPFGTGFFLQGKVGAAFSRAQGFGFTDYRTNVLLGAGAGYDFPNGFSVLGEYEYFGRAGDPSVNPASGAITGTGRADLHLFSVSGMVRF